MGALFSILGLGPVKAELAAIGRHASGQAALTLALALTAVTATGCALAALVIWLASEVGAAGAFAIVATGLAAAMAVLQLAIVLRRRRRERLSAFKAGPSALSGQAALGSIAALALVGYLLGRQTERH